MNKTTRKRLRKKTNNINSSLISQLVISMIQKDNKQMDIKLKVQNKNNILDYKEMT